MKNSAMCVWLSIAAALMLQIPLTAESGTPAWLPMFGYDQIRLDSETGRSITAGGAVLGEDVLFSALYTRTIFGDDPAPGYCDAFHGIEALLDMNRGRHQIVGLFKSESDRPVAGGLTTFQAAAVYGYEVISGSALNLAVGGGLAVSNFGIESPLIPVPFIRMGYVSPILEAQFDFITGPNMALTLFPRGRIRLNGDIRIDEFRDIRDLLFEASLEYRFFAPESSMGDLAGIALGFTSESLSYVCSRVDESYELQYYAVFARLDLTLLELSGGYAFKGRELYEDDNTNDAGDGYFVSLSALWQF